MRDGEEGSIKEWVRRPEERGGGAASGARRAGVARQRWQRQEHDDSRSSSPSGSFESARLFVWLENLSNTGWRHEPALKELSVLVSDLTLIDYQCRVKSDS